MFGDTDGTPGGSACPLCDSTVNFAVWETEGEFWTNEGPFAGLTIEPLQIDGDGVDSDARYVYLYQVINTDPLDVENPQIENFNIATTAVDGSGDPGVGVPFTSGGQP